MVKERMDPFAHVRKLEPKRSAGAPEKVSRRITGNRKGGIQMVTYDATRSMVAALPFVNELATRTAAGVMNEEMMRLFRTKGDGQWAQNTDLTKMIKGHSITMVGRTRAALRALQGGTEAGAGRMIQGSAIKTSVTGSFLQYGWPEDPHPDADGSYEGGWGKDESPGRSMTIADVMTLHEFGYTARVPVRGGFKDVDVPPRPWLTLAADNVGHKILIAMSATWDGSMHAFFRAHNTRAQMLTGRGMGTSKMDVPLFRYISGHTIGRVIPRGGR